MYNFYRIYGGDLLPAALVDSINDWIPIRDASEADEDDKQHKKISIADLKTTISSVVITTRNPTISDILEGNGVIWYNAGSEDTYNYANLEGQLWRSQVWSVWIPSPYNVDSTLIFADDMFLTADLI